MSFGLLLASPLFVALWALGPDTSANDPQGPILLAAGAYAVSIAPVLWRLGRSRPELRAVGYRI